MGGMRSLRITQTIYLLAGMALLAGGLAPTYLMFRWARVSAGYTATLQGEIAQAQQVRVLQVSFKKEVQAWKDILLRGKDDAALSEYEAEFRTLSRRVQTRGPELASQIGDADARTSLENFARQHKVLQGQFDQALVEYKASRNVAAADEAVAGKDRPLTDSLDLVALRLSGLAQAIPNQQALRLKRERSVLIALLVLIWVSLGVWSILFACSLELRMARAVDFVRAIDGGDLTAAEPETGRADELGQLIDAVDELRDRRYHGVGQTQPIYEYFPWARTTMCPFISVRLRRR
jgi:methyl-accepting chemotaxis protein